MTGIRSTIRIMPMMSNTIPERTILVIGISPEYLPLLVERAVGPGRSYVFGHDSHLL
jgi:hypothetical protein